MTLEGKILITKTFGLSQILYVLQSTYIKQTDLKLIDDIIYRFIWNIKNDSYRVAGKISRKTLTSSIEKGGLKAPDIFAIDKAIKYKALLVNTSQDHPIKDFYDNCLSEMNFNYANYSSSFTTDTFIGKAVKTHIDNFKNIKEHICKLSNDVDGIHKNYYSVIQNHNVINNNFINVRQNNMTRRLIVYNIDTFQKLAREKDERRFPALYLDVHQIYNSFPLEWRVLIRNTRRTHMPVVDQVNVGLNKWVTRENISLKILTAMLSDSLGEIDMNTYLERKHPGIGDRFINNPFVTIRKIKDVKIRNLQFKMLHNIYPTMAHLKKWKIKDSENCDRCQIKETLSHAVFNCPIAQTATKHLENEIKNRYFSNSVNNIS